MLRRLEGCMAASAIELEINGRTVRIKGVDVNTTLLQYLREDPTLCGTKEGCAEGDCGACTVALLDTEAPDGPSWRAINSCLVLVGSLHGRRLVTVEGLKGDAPHPVQTALSDHLGSQCGYCTPGVILSMFEAAYRDDLDADWKLDDQMCGNLCRCTGYRPIREATEAVAGSHPPGPHAEALSDPPYEVGALQYHHDGRNLLVPTTLNGLFQARSMFPHAKLVAGATDLGLYVTKQHTRFDALISILSVDELRGIREDDGGWRIGATTRLSDLETWADTHLVPLARMLRFFGSRQIKNRGTVGGNLVNASPIGDIAPVLVALRATVIAASPNGERAIPIDEFHPAYRQTTLGDDEILAAVHIPKPPSDARMGAYKVSKRREMDISAVSAAMFLQTTQGRVTTARFAFGGMAATTARATRAEAAVIGQPWNEDTVRRAMEAIERDFSPMSDHRGSSWYRMRVAKNLLLGFFAETEHTPVVRLPDRPGGTVVVEGQP
jgi:xanthine dehydrogenase small subunit